MTSPKPEIARSAVILGEVHVGAGAILAQGLVVRAHGAAVSIGNYAAILANGVVIATREHPVRVGQRTVFGQRADPISATLEAFSRCDGTYGEGYRNSVQMYGPDEDDVVEHGGAPLRLPGWARRPRWLLALGWRPSRGAAIFGLAGLVIGLAAGYALGYRHLGQAVRPSRAAAAGAVPSAVAGSAAPSDSAAAAGNPGAYSSSLGISGLTGLAQAVGACSVQRGQELQVGVEVINLSGTAVTLGQVRPILPLGGLRLVSQQWAPCGAWQPAEGGTVVFIGASTGEVEAKNAAGAAVLPPYGTGWLSVTFRVLVACPRPLPVQFSVSYQKNGRTDTAQLPGFPDLGQVTYTGCKGSS